MKNIFIITLLAMLYLPTNLSANNLNGYGQLMADNNSKASKRKKTKKKKNSVGATLGVNYFGFSAGALYNYKLTKKIELVGNFLYSSANLQDDGENGIKETFEFTTLSLAGGAKYYIFMNFYGGLNLAYSSLVEIMVMKVASSIHPRQ